MTSTTTAEPRRWRRAAALALAALTSLALAAPAQARTDGAPGTDPHPYAGMFLVGPDLQPGCAGALVAPKVFITAAHCLAGREDRANADIYVTFDRAYPGDADGRHFVSGRDWDRDFGHDYGDRHELAVLLLAEPAGIEPAELPPPGYLDQIGRRGTTFDYVGYGGDPEAGIQPGTKRVISAGFQALTPSALYVNTKRELGYGGGCGHSGGPYLPSGKDVVVALFFFRDGHCEAHNRGYRTDTPHARAFLGKYVDLPQE